MLTHIWKLKTVNSTIVSFDLLEVLFELLKVQFGMANGLIWAVIPISKKQTTTNN